MRDGHAVQAESAVHAESVQTCSFCEGNERAQASVFQKGFSLRADKVSSQR